MATISKPKLIKAMLIDNLRIEDVARMLGVCTSSLYTLLKNWDIPARKNLRRKDRINELKQYYYQSIA